MFDTITHGIGRVFIRTFRIACGFVVLCIALVMGDSGWDRLAMPFAQSSFITLLGGLALCGLALVGIVWAWVLAFGEGPPRAPK